MSVIIAAVLISILMIVAPIVALRNTMVAGGAGHTLAIISVLFCLPLCYAWIAALTGPAKGAGDGWYEVVMIVAGLLCGVVAVVCAGIAQSVSNRKKKTSDLAPDGTDQSKTGATRIEPSVISKP